MQGTPSICFAFTAKILFEHEHEIRSNHRRRNVEGKILKAYPDLEPDDIRAALFFAAEPLRERELPFVAIPVKFLIDNVQYLTPTPGGTGD